MNTAPVFLCTLDELQEPGSKGVSITLDSRNYDLFVVRHSGDVRAYLNSCPHTGAPLDWTPDQFLSVDNLHIQCAMHDALFRWQDGACVAGPCTGDELTALPVFVEEGQVMLACDGLPGAGRP